MNARFYAAIFALLLLVLNPMVMAQDEEADAEAPEAGADENPAPPPVADDVFIPSEEVQADEELVFPVNI